MDSQKKRTTLRKRTLLCMVQQNKLFKKILLKLKCQSEETTFKTSSLPAYVLQKSILVMSD